MPSDAVRAAGAGTGFRGDIEGLRGVAVLLVVADHLLGWPRGGFLGVDVFFVLSGFLITGLLLTEVERDGRISLRGFYARRARRLLPAAALVLVVTDLVAAALLLPARAHATVVDSLWALGSAANLWFAHLGTDYFAQNRPASPVQHYWSLSVEEQFYVVWPTLLLLTVLLAVRRGWSARRSLVVVAGLVVAGSFTWSVITAGGNYFSSAARAWELGVGALLALLAPAVRAGRGRQLIAVVSAVALAVSVLVIGPLTPAPGYAAALPVLATVGLLYAAPAPLAVAPLRFLGRISYSLYLWHWPIVVFAEDLPGADSVPARFCLIVLAVLLAMASYSYVETPVRGSSWLSRRPRHALSLRRRLIGPAWALATVVALGAAFVLTAPSDTVRPVVTAVATPTPTASTVPSSSGSATATPVPPAPPLRPLVAEGLRLREWPPGLSAVSQDDSAPSWVKDRCLDVGPRNREKCVYGPRNATTSVALVGDSIAISWMPALRVIAAQEGWRVHILTRRQCPAAAIPPAGAKAVSESCAQHQQWALEEVRALQPDLVIVSSRYGGASPKQWQQGMTKTLGALAGDRVFALEAPPDTGNLQQCFTRFSDPQDCIAPLTEEHVAFARAERAAAIQAKTGFIPTAGWTCLRGRCPAVIADLPVHVDGEHLSAQFARFLAPTLREALVS